jgi:type IV pilus assembly protein PilM
MALLPVGDVRQMLKLNSKNYLQQEMPDHVFDCCYVVSSPTRAAAKGPDGKDSKPAPAPLPTAGQKHKMFVGGARRQLIEDLQAAIKSVGLVPDQIVPGLVGPLNAFELSEPEMFGRETVALVEVGFRNTTIMILDCGEVRLHRVVAIGGDRLTTGLAEMLKISYAEAENIKVGMPQEVQANLEAMLSPLGRELRASIDFYEHQHDRTVSQVFVSGGSACSEVIVQSLQTELMVPCKAWLPTRALNLNLPPEKMAEVEQLAPQLSVAVGAALMSF